MTIRERVFAILAGRKPDRLPFIDRLDVWYACHRRGGTIPEEFKGMSLTDIHQAVGLGQQRYLVPYALKLRGVEVISRFNGEEVYHEQDPVIEFFCGVFGPVDYERPGITVNELRTPVGRLRVCYELLQENVATGTEPYLKEHLIKEESDYRTVEYILERAEYVAQHEKVRQEAKRIGGAGFVIPMTHRIPFQQLLLEYLGEVPLFYALHDQPRQVERLMALLDEQLVDILHRLGALEAVFVEFPDNLHGLITNPRLFAKYCLPAYQRYSEILHAQGKKTGSHTDGNVKPLLGLLAESGLDVCESFSPAPLTECTFDEAWHAWRGGPLIWGGIPSPILEERTSEEEFQAYIEHLLEVVGDQPIILGVGDMVMGHNSIERVRYIARRVEEHDLGRQSGLGRVPA